MKTKFVISCFIFIVSFLCFAQAEVITLKSGKVIDGQIIEKAKDYIKIRFNGQEIYYENKYIKNMEAQETPVLPAGAQKEELPEDEVTPSFKKGVELAAQGNFEQARSEFEKQFNDLKGALAVLDYVDRGSISKECATYLFQGFSHIINKEYKLATESLEKAWEINPKDPDINYNLGFVYYSLGDYEKSAVYLSAALKLQPDDAGARELLNKVLSRQPAV